MNMFDQLKACKKAAMAMQRLSYAERGKLLTTIADKLRENADDIFAANALDLAKMEPENPLYDRLKLDEKRLESIAQACCNIATQTDPLGEVLEERDLASGLNLQKVTVPMGVICCIYEARPNVTVDITALSIISGNAVALRGSSNAVESNRKLVAVMHQAYAACGVPAAAATLLETSREEMADLLHADEYIDIIIPRGGKNLINRVRTEATIPVIETGAGVCHTYVDATADLDMAHNIVVNAKTSRPSVCNALDTMIIHESIENEFYVKLGKALREFKVKVYADEASKAKFGDYPHLYSMEEDSWGTEYLSYAMSVKTVASVEEAIDHINEYGSTHSEAIVSETPENVLKFFNEVDASSVYHNASTRFTDGEEFGLGAEVGISTQKLHARGPMGASALTTYKYLLRGNGTVR